MVIEKILSIAGLERCNNTKESIKQCLEFDMSEFSIDSIISLEDDIGGRVIRFDYNTTTKVLKMLGTEFLTKGKQNLRIKYYSLKEDRDKKLKQILEK